MGTAKLTHLNNHLIIENFQYHQEDIYYNTSFDLQIRSGSFCGIAFCEYDIKEFRMFVQDLLKMYDFQKETAVLNDICYGSNVQFKADKSGHIEVSGIIFGEAQEHSLKFSFMTDQTALKQFVLELQNMICN